MKLIALNRHRDREPAQLGPVETWPTTPEQTARVRACRDRALADGNVDLADFYEYQLDNAARHCGGSGSAA